MKDATVDDCIAAVDQVSSLAFPRWRDQGWRVGLAPLDGYYAHCDRRARELVAAWGEPVAMLEALFAHQIVHALGIDGHGAPVRAMAEIYGNLIESANAAMHLCKEGQGRANTRNR